MSKYRLVTLGDVLLVTLTAVCVWAVVPSLGPELANLPIPGYSCQVIPKTKVDVVDAWKELCRLRVRHDVGAGGYQREFFGSGWKDLDHDGCDTRAEILARDFQRPRFDTAKPCRLIGGVFRDPYTGNTSSFSAAPGAAVQIDHVVALGDAWSSGANLWSNAQRQKYANDPGVLLAVDGKANQDKGKLAADGWLPENKRFRCAYARQQINIKYRWDLSVTAAEREVLLRILARC